MISSNVLVVILTVFIENGSSDECAQEWRPHGTKCYMISSDRKTWSEALEACGGYNGTLASVTDRATNDFLWNWKNTEGSNREFWIGLTATKDTEEWYWNDGSRFAEGTLNWSTSGDGEPTGDSTCARIQVDGTLADRPCQSLYHFICQADQEVEGWNKIATHWFFFSETSHDIYYASKYCFEKNGFLTRADVIDVLEKRDTSREYWIGLSRRKWTDGSPYLWHNFKTTETDKDGPGDCYVLDYSQNKWVEGDGCDKGVYYICQKDQAIQMTTSTTTTQTTSTTLDMQTPTKQPSQTKSTVLSLQFSTQVSTTNEFSNTSIMDTTYSILMTGDDLGVGVKSDDLGIAAALLYSLIAIGALVVICIVIIIVLLVLHRRRKNKHSDRLHTDGDYQLPSISGSQSSAQANTKTAENGGNAASEQKTTTASDGVPIYAVPNKKK